MTRERYPTGSVYLRGTRWAWRFRWRGQSYSETTEATTKTEARALLAAAIVRVTGAAPRDADAVTLGALVEAWDRNEADVSRVRAVVEAIGPDRSPDELETADIVAWAEARVEDVAPATVRRDASLLSSLYQWALARRLAQRNPVRGAPLPALARRRRDGLERPQVAQLLAAVEGDAILEPAYRLALFAGMRRGEVARARWEDIDLEAGTIVVRGTKTDASAATLPLHRDLAAWLAPRAIERGPVIPGRFGQGIAPDALEKARKRHPADLPGFHLMRHTLATILIRQGVELGRISRILRHSSVRVTESFYAHLRPVDCRDDLDSFSV